MKDLIPILVFLIPLLVPVAIAWYGTTAKRKQKREDWGLEKRLDLFTRVHAHYDSHERRGVIRDWVDSDSQKLISEAKLLAVSPYIVDLMEEEAKVRANPDLMSYTGLSPDVVVYEKSQAVVREVREELRRTIHGQSLLARLVNAANGLGWYGYDMASKYRIDPLFWWVFVILPTLGIVGLAALLVNYFHLLPFVR